ncbi:dihydrolipoyl dehydrogenase [Arcanobacterium haemolyticum]|uniref:Dihydrolipoyl dehydrogenase n=1 Tax=Arcanobacterium haemolyticum (strain ATCC 9345 / DSM 20595 / CCM 5947 / CCUG 17215 / LMG 16163 / NBRC 15585 / NCTC 8452 / 11018) TaxID=644284 RepID=D7BNG9_ARCHD|nr:dihydrolipoyl dehydrogenase [Arcanobacterium haemolyticum]ADH92468.1 dihydrolipoamide dehydrogenase [Arcanobacterium haemolyticum DSM 20595]QCX46598.1 dihydrolipoyl dehydrogenase [Arcanobacterium haemolyticum]SPT75181.1 Dihydrolipoyl dehydrogenase [Arcanobacterium haemolyticum]SQH28802.1 Dihydrolipoyl dehydrogenase [Arcanobacterium haemolyticum]
MSDTQEYDIVILGAGSGGYATAMRAAQLGLSVALVEGDKVGGTCLHRGCIPTKALLHVAEVADEMREGAHIGIKGSFDGIDMDALNAYKDGVITKMYKGLTGLIDSRGIETINGWGRLVSQDTVEVNGRRLKGKNIVLASGSYSKTIGQTITDRVITSEQALKLDRVPKSVVVLGGGVIGVEFASVWASFGTEVTIIEGLDRLVPNEDPAISKLLERQFRKRKIAFKTKTMFDRVEEDENGVHVFTQDGKQFDADMLLIAIGRGPATQNLGYAEQGIKLDRDFVITNERLHTGVGNIYAVGDIVPGVQLAHRGFLHGLFVAEEIAGMNPKVVDENLIPKVTFCDPEISSVGLTQPKAEEKYGKENVDVAEFNLAGNGKSQMLGTTGFVKLVREKNGPIVGFHAIGARMGEQVGEGELMVAWEAFPEDFDGLIHAHPSQNESLGEAVLALAGKPLHTHN